MPGDVAATIRLDPVNHVRRRAVLGHCRRARDPRLNHGARLSGISRRTLVGDVARRDLISAGMVLAQQKGSDDECEAGS
jgi:hypothetical protein